MLRAGKRGCFVCLFFVHNHPGALSETLRYHLPSNTAGQERRRRSCFLIIHGGLKGASRPLRWSRTGADESACFVSIDCTDFFRCYLCFFFYNKKYEKRGTQRKKNYKKTWKIQQKNNAVSLYTSHTEQAHIPSQHTHTHTAVSSLAALLEIRLIRFRKIIIKLMNGVGKQNTAWQALLQTHTHTKQLMNMHTNTLPGIICSAPKSFFTVVI